MLITKLTIHLRSLDGIAACYQRALGCAVASDGPERLSIELGETTVEMVESTSGGVHHVACNIPAGSIGAARRSLAGRVKLQQDSDGAEIVRFESWDAEALYFLDPVGNVVELIARAEIKDAAGPDSERPTILNISEVGIAVPRPVTVRAAADAIQKAFGITPYRSISDDFAALGTARGLLILVPEGRPWFMGGGAVATNSPLHIELAALPGSLRIGAVEITGRG